jgi:hypothetical protein
MFNLKRVRAVQQDGLFLKSPLLNHKPQGGILLTVLLLVFLFSFLFEVVLDDYRIAGQFTKKTSNYYLAKTMASMFLLEAKEDQTEKSGQQKFSSGILYYEYQEDSIAFTVKLDNQVITFHEKTPVKQHKESNQQFVKRVSNFFEKY